MDYGLAYLAICVGLLIDLSTPVQHDRASCDVCWTTPRSCDTVQGTFDLEVLNTGYNPVIEIPADACSINIYELEASGNFLALKTSDNHDIINSRWAIAAPGEHPGAGTVFTYNRGRGPGCPGECTSAPGPTNQAVFVEIMYYNKNPGISYYYKLLPEVSHRSSIHGDIGHGDRHNINNRHRHDKHAHIDQYQQSNGGPEITSVSSETTPREFREDDLIHHPKISEHIAPKAISRNNYLSSSSEHSRNHRKYRFNPAWRLGGTRGAFKETYGQMLQKHIFSQETITSSSSSSTSSSEDVDMYRGFEEPDREEMNYPSGTGITWKDIGTSDTLTEVELKEARLNPSTDSITDIKTTPTPTASTIPTSTAEQRNQNLENIPASTMTIPGPANQQTPNFENIYTHSSTDAATTTETTLSPTILAHLHHSTPRISSPGKDDAKGDQDSFIPSNSKGQDRHISKHSFWRGEFGGVGNNLHNITEYERPNSLLKEIADRKESFIPSTTYNGEPGPIVQQPLYHQEQHSGSFIRHSQEPEYVGSNDDVGIPLRHPQRFHPMGPKGRGDMANINTSPNRNLEYPKSRHGRTRARKQGRRHHRRKDLNPGYFTNYIDADTDRDIGNNEYRGYGDNSVEDNVIPVEYFHEGEQKLYEHQSRRHGKRLNDNAAYEWKITGFTNCTRTCGEEYSAGYVSGRWRRLARNTLGIGRQETIIVCIRRNSQVTENNCDPSKKPAVLEIKCNKHICEPDWETEDWSQCSVSCGSGTQSRTVSCKRRISSSLSVSVSASQCDETTKPAIIQQCGEPFCATWDSSDWTPCSVTCGRGQQSRLVTCQESGNKVVSRNKCPRPAPKNHRSCSPGPCTRQWFVSTHSSQCSADCGSGVITRDVYCMSRRGRSLKDGHCSDKKPWSEQPCRANNICTGQWFTGTWTKCSASCGSGKRTRDVVCMERLGGSLATPLSDDKCLKDDRPTEEETCHEKYCDRKWFVTSWSKCTVECAGGYQTRDVQCLDGKQRRSKDCDTNQRPASKQTCNQLDCSTDKNSTISRGGCRDKYGHCHVVVQARLCKFSYYSSICCASCSLDKEEQLSP